jgi:hypothetical protein
MGKSEKKDDRLDDQSKRTLIAVGVITFVLLGTWIFVLWSRQGNLPWYTDILNGSTTSFFFAFVIMFFENRFQQEIYSRDEFFKSLKKHGIKNMHHDKKKVLSTWLREAEKEVCITGYRLIMTLDLLDDLIFALNNSKELKVKFLTCPPWSDTYKKIFDDDSSLNYAFIFKKLKEKIPDFDKRIAVKFTDKPLFNDTYITDNYLITSPYVHNRSTSDSKTGVITADKFFSLEIANDSSLFQFFRDDFMSVWENEKTVDMNADFALFDAKDVEDRLTRKEHIAY